MKRMQKKFLFFSSLCLIVFIYYIIYDKYFLNIQFVNSLDISQFLNKNKSSQSNLTNNLINSSNLKESKSHIKEETLNNYCEVNGEWLSLGTQIFFKKAAAYYLIDLDIIYLNLITLRNRQYRFEFDLNAKIANKEDDFNFFKVFSNYTFYSIEAWATSYQSSTIKIDFNLRDELSKIINKTIDVNNLTSIKLFLYVYENNSKEYTRLPLDLKLKYSPLQNSQTLDQNQNLSSIAICSKVLFIDNERQFSNFKLWVYLNEVFGYDKLVVYNRPGYVFDQDRNDFFRKNEKFIEIRQQICMPNLFNATKKEKYFGNLTRDQIRDQIYSSFDTTAFVFLNECYLDHFDKFNYITAKDTDEIMMPMRLHEFAFKKTDFYAYFNSLINSIPTYQNRNASDLNHRVNKSMARLSSKPDSILFSYSNFIKNDNFDRFCQKLNYYLSEPNSNSSNSSILTFDEDISSGSDNEDRFKVHIDKNNLEELGYAVNLCQINEKYVKPLLKSKPKLARLNFSRFFSCFYKIGKSIHKSSNVLTISTHSAFIQYIRTNRTDLYYSHSNYCYECGYSAHFREKQSFHEHKYINITNVYFDSLYFNLVSQTQTNI